MPHGTRFHFLSAVHGFLIRENKILLLERANTGYMDGWFGVPAGHIDGNETIWEAVQREVREEVGVHLLEQVLPHHVMHRVTDDERIDFFFVINEWEGEPHNAEAHKCAQVAWHELTNLPENTIPYIRFALEEIEKKNHFSEFWLPK